MKVVSVKYKNTHVPQGSCGTGYSQPSRFEVTFDTGRVRVIVVELWYVPVWNIKSEFEKSVKCLGKVSNHKEFYRMFCEQIVGTCCPYSLEEILNEKS